MRASHETSVRVRVRVRQETGGLEEQRVKMRKRHVLGQILDFLASVLKCH